MEVVSGGSHGNVSSMLFLEARRTVREVSLHYENNNEILMVT